MVPLPADDPKVREACRERCAEFGDPACWQLANSGQIDVFDPCDPCLADAGIDLIEPFDENAAIGRLL
jgi:hypothetical protein